MQLDTLKLEGNAPQWMTEEGYTTLKNGYLQGTENPKQMYERVANGAAQRLNKPELANKFYEYINNNWLCLATPVAANMGGNRALPISCYSSYISDNTSDIFNSYHELAHLAKFGGGCGSYVGAIRGRGSPISGGGFSDGVVGWIKIQESVISTVSQSSTRRGALATYNDIEHIDIEEFINIRRPIGDLSRRCLSTNFHHGVCVGDQFMQEMIDGDKPKRNIWEQLLAARVETGEPYLMFRDNANKNLPQAYINNNLKCIQSNLCNEVFLHTDKDHTFVCCLSSLNLARYDEWKDTDLIETAIYFLDAVMEEFIQKAKNLPGLEKAVRFAIKSRALGLGVLGWHSYLQDHQIAFDDPEAMMINNIIFRKMKKESYEASQKLAKEYGEPEWCKGTGMRNTHTMALAPTVSNSQISGNSSASIEPNTSNYFAQKSAKGVFIKKNPSLEKHLISINKNTFDTWEQINNDSGSVKNLDFLSEEEKDVFKTAREINQFAIIKQAAQRQKYIDQGQSINLFFSVPKNIEDIKMKKDLAKYIFDVHLEAWQMGLKGLYYLRAESTLKGDNIYRSSDCKACEG